MTSDLWGRWRVTGRVQGVCFRASCRQQALHLGLRGSAVNLPDGSVEVRAFGTPEAVHAMQRWLWQGPALARVDTVIALDASHAACPPEGFVTG